jgi:putative transposase
MAMVTDIGSRLGIAPTCRAFGLPRATYYRRLQPPRARSPRRPSPRALRTEEQTAVLAVLHEPRFVDLAPAEVYATLLDEGRYLCSERTMYRLLAAYQEVRERRNQLRHPRYAAPELLARRPNELWSWDITKLLGPAKWTYFYLYVVLDVFSRYVVGWMVAHRESATLAERFIRETCARQRITPDRLTIHADRGPAMTSKPVALLFADLGVTKTHARPHVSNDNPFSEAQFKTLKYRPEFPERFESLEQARIHLRRFFAWYNDEHRHSGIGFMTPAMVHFGRSSAIDDQRRRVLQAAYAAHPERFKGRPPTPPTLPDVVGINLPQPETMETPNGPMTTPALHTNFSTEVSQSH